MKKHIVTAQSNIPIATACREEKKKKTTTQSRKTTRNNKIEREKRNEIWVA